MRVPNDTVSVGETEGGFVARTSLLDGPTGTGGTEKEAVASLNLSVREHLRMARAQGLEIPEELRTPGTTKLLVVALFLGGLVIIRLLLRCWF